MDPFNDIYHCYRCKQNHKCKPEDSLKNAVRFLYVDRVKQIIENQTEENGILGYVLRSIMALPSTREKFLCVDMISTVNFQEGSIFQKMINPQQKKSNGTLLSDFEPNCIEISLFNHWTYNWIPKLSADDKNCRNSNKSLYWTTRKRSMLYLFLITWFIISHRQHVLLQDQNSRRMFDKICQKIRWQMQNMHSFIWKCGW